MAKKSLTVKEAIAILVGAGIKVDEKKKLQIWTLGNTVSDKVLKAASVLDSQLVDDGNGGLKPDWKTKWVHQEGCACVACLQNPKLMALRPLLKPQYSKPPKKQHHKPAKKKQAEA